MLDTIPTRSAAVGARYYCHYFDQIEMSHCWLVWMCVVRRWAEKRLCATFRMFVLQAIRLFAILCSTNVCRYCRQFRLSLDGGPKSLNVFDFCAHSRRRNGLPSVWLAIYRMTIWIPTRADCTYEIPRNSPMTDTPHTNHSLISFVLFTDIYNLRSRYGAHIKIHTHIWLGIWFIIERSVALRLRSRTLLQLNR